MGGTPLLEQLRAALIAGAATGPQATASLLIRLCCGGVFVVFGAGKFVDHASEVDSFRTYGLPSPDAFVTAIGILELAGGILLIVGLATRLAALLLAGNMVAAIITSGIGQGEVISLTLAPAQLAGMLFLLWSGPGRLALDRRLTADPRRQPETGSGSGTAYPTATPKS
jgi:putative oxidoreductase